MRIEGKVREPNKGVYEIAFNAPFRNQLPRRSGDGAPLMMKIGGDEFKVRIFRAIRSEYTHMSSNVGRKDKKLYDVVREHGFKVGDKVYFDYDAKRRLLRVVGAFESEYEPKELEEKSAKKTGLSVPLIRTPLSIRDLLDSKKKADKHYSTDERKSSSTQHTKQREQAIKKHVLNRAYFRIENGKLLPKQERLCENEECKNPRPFKDSNDEVYLEIHHINRAPDNRRLVVAICANCHRETDYGQNREDLERRLVEYAKEKEDCLDEMVQ